MKRIVSFLMAGLCCLSLGAQAPDNKPQSSQNQSKNVQDNKTQTTQDERKKQYEEMRLKQIAYFTESIGLTATEAEEFWPVVNDIRDRRWKINREIRRCFRQGRDQKDEKNPSTTGIDYEKTVARLMQLRSQEADLEKECYDKLKKILSPEKLYKYYKAEEDFSFDLLRSFEKDNHKR